MGPRWVSVVIFALVTPLSYPDSVDADPTSRTWTDVKGLTVEAQFLDCSADKVTLRRSHDGKEFQITLDSLTEADRDYIRTTSASPPSDAVVSDALPSDAPVSGALETSGSPGGDNAPDIDPNPEQPPRDVSEQQLPSDADVLVRVLTANGRYVALAGVVALLIFVLSWILYRRNENCRDSDKLSLNNKLRVHRPLAVKLLFYLLFLSGLASLLTALIIGKLDYDEQLRTLKSRLSSIATAVAQKISGESHESIESKDDEDSDEYNDICDILEQVQSFEPDIKYAYTLRKTDSPEILSFVVDSQETFDSNGDGEPDPDEEKAHVGQPYNAEENAPNMLIGFDHVVVEDEFETDQWGTTLSAYAPIRKGDQEVVGIVGIDVDARRITSIARNSILLALVAFAMTLVMAVPLSLHFAASVSQPLKSIKTCLEKYAKGDRAATVSVKSRDEIGLVAHAVNEMIKTVHERDLYKNALVRYVSSSVAEQLLQHPQDVFMRGQRKHVTILFADVRNFTKMAAELPPEEVISILNSHFEVMIEIIFKCGGTLDKFLGDGLMAVFGAPLDLANHECRACEAALEIQQAITKLRIELEIPSLSIGIGINSGMAVVGSVGSERRMEYTAIGEQVNLASRLESATRPLNVDILVSESTFSAIKFDFAVDRFNDVQLKGIPEAVTAYAIRGRKDEPSKSSQKSSEHVDGSLESTGRVL